MILKIKIFGHINDCALFVLFNSTEASYIYFLEFFTLPFYLLRKIYVTAIRIKFSSRNQSTTKTLYQFPHSLQKSVVADALNSLVGEGERLDY